MNGIRDRNGLEKRMKSRTHNMRKKRMEVLEETLKKLCPYLKLFGLTRVDSSGITHRDYEYLCDEHKGCKCVGDPGEDAVTVPPCPNKKEIWKCLDNPNYKKS